MPSPWVTRALTNALPASDRTGLITVSPTESTSAWDHEIDSWDATANEIEAWADRDDLSDSASDRVWAQDGTK